MQTVAETTQIHNTQIHFRHGQDLAILGLSRSLCRNRFQVKGYQQMEAYMDGWKKCAEQTTGPCPVLDAWASELVARRSEAEARRNWALALKEEGRALAQEGRSPFGTERIQPEFDVAEVA